MTMQESDFWHQVMNTISEGLFLVDRLGRISNVNKALCQLTGYAKEEILGQPCSIFQCDTCATMRDGSVENWCHLFDTGKVSKRRCTIRHKSGEVIPILKNASLLHCDSEDRQRGNCDGSLFSVETITDLREILQKEAYLHRVEKLLTPTVGFQNMVGASSVMQRVFRLIEQVAESNAPVFIFGESGTGKELVAQAVHALSNRKDQPFVELNCAALNEHVLESELFGHVKGSFTGATKDRKGRFEAAHGGSLFLDEIGDIQLSTQVKILRVLETGIINKVGSNAPENVNVRIISATNKHLPTLVRSGLFREDLAFRINVIPIFLPPLRKRVDDIPLLIAHFLKNMQELSGTKTSEVSPALMQAFKAYPWPGNIRELRNLLEYGSAMSDGSVIDLNHMPDSFQAYGASNESPLETPVGERLFGTVTGAMPGGGLEVMPEAMAEALPESLPEAMFNAMPPSTHTSAVSSIHPPQSPDMHPAAMHATTVSSAHSEGQPVAPTSFHAVAGTPQGASGPEAIGPTTIGPTTLGPSTIGPAAIEPTSIESATFGPIPRNSLYVSDARDMASHMVGEPVLTDVQQRQKEEILNALAATGGNVSQAAKILNIHRTTVVNRMLRLGLRIQKKVLE